MPDKQKTGEIVSYVKYSERCSEQDCTRRADLVVKLPYIKDGPPNVRCMCTTHARLYVSEGLG